MPATPLSLHLSPDADGRDLLLPGDGLVALLQSMYTSFCQERQMYIVVGIKMSFLALGRFGLLMRKTEHFIRVSLRRFESLHHHSFFLIALLYSGSPMEAGPHHRRNRETNVSAPAAADTFTETLNASEGGLLLGNPLLPPRSPPSSAGQ